MENIQLDIRHFISERIIQDINIYVDIGYYDDAISLNTIRSYIFAVIKDNIEDKIYSSLSDNDGRHVI